MVMKFHSYVDCNCYKSIIFVKNKNKMKLKSHIAK